MPRSIELAHQPPFNIGPLVVCPSTRELRRDGQTVIIEPRVMQVLIALARADGAVVTRDELVEQCWDGRIVGDDAIHRVLSRLRRIAEGVASGVFRVETITRVGYRLMPSLSCASSPALSRNLGQGAGTKPIPGAAKFDRRAALAGGGAAISIAAACLWSVTRNSNKPPSEVQNLLHHARESLKEGTADRVAAGVSLLRKATEIAPQRAETWGALALAYQKQSMRSSSAAARQFEARGIAAANRALALEPDNADALAALATMRPFFRRWSTYDAACRQVLARYPRHWDLNISYGHFLSATGRSRSALIHLGRAMSVDPLSPQLQWQVAQDLWCAGRLDEADRAMDRAFALWPRHYAVWFVRNRLHNYTGRAKTTLAIVDDRDARPVGYPEWNFELSRLEARALDTRSAEHIEVALDAHLSAARRALVFAENAVIFASAVGHVDKAFAVLGPISSIADSKWATSGSQANRGCIAREASGLRPFCSFRPPPPSAPIRVSKRW